MTRTAKQIAAQRKATAASARARRGRGVGARRFPKGFRVGRGGNRGSGVAGLKKNATPYVRVNKRSQTSGFNTGTIIPGTKKRIVIGGYFRLENTNRKGAIDRAMGRAANGVLPHGTKRGQARKYLKDNVTITNPAVRAKVGGAEVRLASSRGAGPTVVIRRGKHKTNQKASQAGIKKYDNAVRKRAAKAAKKRKSRLQRRG